MLFLNTDMQKNNEIVIILILGIKKRKKLKLISFCDTVCIDIKNTLLLGKVLVKVNDYNLFIIV